MTKGKEPEFLNSQEKLVLIRKKHAAKATNDEFKLFLHMAKKYDVDILSGHIVFVKYKDGTVKIYATRDGFLHIAHKSKQFDGIETNVRVEDGEYVAKCKVYRKDFKHPIISEVYEKEYNSHKNVWAKKPRTMIAKVAESQALRKAFDISGIYDEDEMFGLNIEKDETNNVPQKPLQPLLSKEEEKELMEKVNVDIVKRLKTHNVAAESIYKFCKHSKFDNNKISFVLDIMDKNKMNLTDAYKIAVDARFKVSNGKPEEEKINESMTEENNSVTDKKSESKPEEKYEI